MKGQMHMRVLHNGPLVFASGLMTTAVASMALAVLPPLAAAGPPGGRAYELVSPNDPGGTLAGVDANMLPYPGLVGKGRDRLVYGATSSIGEAANGTQNPLVFGERTPHGWTASTAIRTTDGGETATELISSEPTRAWVNPDASELAFRIGKTLGPPNDIPGLSNSAYRVAAGGLPEWLSAPTSLSLPRVPTGVSQEFVASADFSTFVFEASTPLTPEAPPSGTKATYAWRGGQLQLVGILPNNSVPTEPSRPANPGSSGATAAAMLPALTYRNMVSHDGSTVLFTVGGSDDAQALYARNLDTAVTHELAGPGSPALPFVANNAGNAGLGWGPTGDVSILPQIASQWSVVPGYTFSASEAPLVYFRSAANLAPGASGTAPNKVYRADLTDGSITYIPGIDGPPVGVSPDGKRVLFLQPTGTSDDPWSLRYWEDTAPSASVALGVTAGALQTRSVRSSKDGRTWVFTSTGSMDPQRPAVDPTKRQLYRWTAGDAAPRCLSCETTDGVSRLKDTFLSQGESDGSETLRVPAGVPAAQNQRALAVAQPSRAISDDGDQVAFDSPDRLLPGDQNDLRDVYLWDANAAPESQLQLVSGGSAAATGPSYYIDITADGQDVFFATQDGLVASDVDRAYDVYVAREGGGIPEDDTPPCVGEACRPPAVDPPAFRVPDSILDGPVTRGAAIALPKAMSKFRVRAPRVVRRTVRLTVDTPAAGRITVSGRNAKSRSRTAKRSTAYTIVVSLSAAGRRALARDGKVRLRLAVKFKAAEGGGNARSTVVTTIRRAGR